VEIKELAKAGAKVYLAARNESRATGALAQLETEGLTNVHWFKLDLDDPKEVKKSAEEFMRRENRLDVLVNNAGLISSPYELGKDGIAKMAVANYISPFVFTETLLPLLRKTAEEPDSDARIVNLTSKLHRQPTVFKVDSVEDFNTEYANSYFANTRRYAHSKLCGILWSNHLQRRLLAESPVNPVTVISVHPGLVDTFLHKEPFVKHIRPLITPFFLTPAQGAHNSVFAAASKKVKDNKEAYRGGYIEGGNPVGNLALPNKLAQDENLGERLYETTKKVLAGIGLDF